MRCFGHRESNPDGSTKVTRTPSFRWVFQHLTGRLRPTMRSNMRRTEDPFRVLVAVVLSTRTRDEIREKVCERLFQKFPDASSLRSEGPRQR